MTESETKQVIQTRRDDLSIQLLLEAVYAQYGYDFRNYSRAHIKRRVVKFREEQGCEHYGILQHRVLHEEDFFYDLLEAITVNTTEMFRDPEFYQVFREQVVPILATYAGIKVWHAGCSTGEEVYSMAILLKEEGLYDRSMLYATDVSEEAMKQAREGIYPAERLQEYTRNYQKANGAATFSDYYTSRYKMAVFNKDLRKNVIFAAHNLVTDTAFSEMHVVICRNVMIYFNQTLQQKVFKLFEQGLCRKGYLCLGSKETLEGSSVAELFETVQKGERIYRKRS